MKTVYICSPYRGEVKCHEEKARDYSRQALAQGFVPIASHLLFPQFLNDHLPDDRITALRLSREVLSRCDEIWVYGPKLTSGMTYLVSAAKELGIPFRLFYENGQAINPQTMAIDDRVSSTFAIACSGHNVIYAADQNRSRHQTKATSLWDKLFG